MNTHKKLPILPKATAIWLIENTALTFEQIGDFCGMHKLEIKSIADGEVFEGIKPWDPIAGYQLTKEEIELCSQDPNRKLQLFVNKAYELVSSKKSQKAKYTPIARRQDKPDAIYWLLKKCPNISDVQIIKLIGTTKTTISAIRDRNHWNMKNIRPRDPVLLGICTQMELDRIIDEVEVSIQQNSKVDS